MKNPTFIILAFLVVTSFLISSEGYCQTADKYYKTAVEKASNYEYDGAIADYSKAIELNPEMALAYAGRGYVKFRINDFNGAIEDCNKCIELDPGIAMAYSTRGLSMLQLRDYVGATADFTKVIELEPANAEVYSYRGTLKHETADYSGPLISFKYSTNL